MQSVASLKGVPCETEAGSSRPGGVIEQTYELETTLEPPQGNDLSDVERDDDEVLDFYLGKFEVTFASDEASRRFSDDTVLVIRAARVWFQYRGVQVKVVRVIGLPAGADVRIIVQLLGKYGVVLDVSREESLFLPGVLSRILVVRLEMHKSVPNLHQCGGDHGPSECKARTNSSATPPVASSSSQEQVSGVAEDRKAAPEDAEVSTQPQPEPISEGAPGGEEQEAGLKLAEAPTLPAATEPSPASSAGVPRTIPADAPAAKDKDEPMSWTDAVRGKKRRARRSPGPSKERLAVASCGGPGSPKDDLPVPKRPAATESDEESTSSNVTGSTTDELSNSSSCPNCGPGNCECSLMSDTRYSSTNEDSLSEGDSSS
ncbi:hypothetical protein HPB51_022288 [Rhipicephalus microplus]|uniref:Uncharacterized protein n=1 Tax=Rhipicephalus microplus TaxID=6941 RepID=A0A9J6DJL6_RHIMP|nr:hypothetical protein HPB51_022288 [Rhipicephalus microplus]